MFDRILVPLDGSLLAEQVLPYASLLARALGSQLELLRVTAPVRGALVEATHDQYRDALHQNLRSEAQAYLEQVRATVLGDDPAIVCTVNEGNAANEIVAAAERRPLTLVAMATHGRSGPSRWLLGSVTDKVLHATHSPLLIIRAAEEEREAGPVELRTVIVPLDRSAESNEILTLLVPLIKALDLDVVLTTAIGVPPQVASLPDAVVVLPDGQVEAVYEQHLSHVTDWLGEQHVHRVERKLLRGAAAPAIVELALETPNSLVAMSTHGRSGVTRSLLGSVTDRVVQQSGDPVLVIRVVPVPHALPEHKDRTVAVPGRETLTQPPPIEQC